MTLVDLLHALRTWLWVALLGILLTISAVLRVVEQPGVYWAQTNVLFLQPSFSTQPNAFSLTQTRVIQMASVVQREVQGVDAAHVVSDSVSIVDEGVRSGAQVRLPNAGGQWANNFDRAVLDVVVVEPTRAAAQARMAEVLDQIERTLDARQTAAGVNAASRVTTQRQPDHALVQYASGRPGLALTITAVVGLGATVALVILLEQSADIRRSRARGRRARWLRRIAAAMAAVGAAERG